MKKIVNILICLFICFNCFAKETIISTYNTKFSPIEVVEVFLEELYKPQYPYKIWTYKVYTQEDKQNYAWAVHINEDGYQSSNGVRVSGYKITLYFKNGYISLNTYSQNTLLNGQETYLISPDYYDSRKSFQKDFETKLSNALYFSKKWLSRYNKYYREDELQAILKLKNLKMIIPEKKTKKYYPYYVFEF